MKINWKLPKVLVAVFVLALTSVLGIALLALPSTSQSGKTANAANEQHVDWGSTDNIGAGTAEDPYRIGSAATLQSYLSANSGAQNKYFVLINDIDMSGVTWSYQYNLGAGSVFDGNNYALNNFTTNDASYRGLFNYLSGTVKNLVFNNVDFIAAGFSGLIAAQVSINTSANWNVVIDNVRIESGTMTLSSTNANGGFIGRINGVGPESGYSVTISNSYNKASINGNRCTGGFVGYVNTSSITLSITNCVNYGDITTTSYYTGGFIGQVGWCSLSTIKLTDCYNEGVISSTSYDCGGLIGNLTSNTNFTFILANCQNKAAISGTTSVAGLVGNHSFNNSSANIYNVNITNCSNEGVINGTSSNVGGLFGALSLVSTNSLSEVYVNVTNCNNTGTITSTSSVAGGIAGVIRLQGYTAAANIEYCTNTAQISGTANLGGIFGQLYVIDYTSVKNSSAVVANCFNEGAVNASNTSTGYAGGIIGSFSSSYSSIRVENCSNEAKITSIGSHCGGIIGVSSWNNSDVTVTHCFNEGEVEITGNTSYAGGIFGSIAGGTSLINIDSCYNKAVIKGYGIVGGITGYSSGSNGEVNITNCYHEGNIIARYYHVGGIIGSIAGSNTPTTIEACYAIGEFTAASTYLGGILGYFNSSSNTTTIRNCFADATLSSSTYQGGVVGGCYTTAYGANLTIYNSYFCTDNTFNQYASADLVPVIARYGNLGEGLTDAAARKTRNEINSVDFMILINAGTNSYVIDEYGILKLSSFYNVRLTFNPNGGAFDEGGTEHKIITINIDSLDSVGIPKRTGYTFVGWNTTRDGSGENYETISAIPTNQSNTYHAKWILTQYSVVASIVELDGTENTAATINVINSTNNLPTENIILNQTGYLSAYLSALDAMNASFIMWQVLNNDGQTWENLGYGAKFPTGQPAEQRLDLVYNYTSIINEDFIERYAQNDNTIVFKAVYATTGVYTINIKIDNPTNGTVKIDGGDALLFNQSGIAEHVYFTNHNADMILTVTSENYRKVAKIEAEYSTDVWTDLSNNGANTTVTIEWENITDGLNIRISYDYSDFDITVIAETRDGVLIDDVADIIINPNGSVSLTNNTFNTATLSSNVTGYRLVSQLFNNIKLWNKLTRQYDYFSAPSGLVDLEITENFLNKYLDEDVGLITVIAEYVRMFEIEVNIINPAYGSVRIEIKEPNKAPETNPTALRPYDEGTIITITVFPDDIARIAEILGYNEGELNANGNKITFILNENRTIDITFDVVQYILTAKAIDINGASIDEIPVTIDGASELIEGEMILISKGSSPDYKFIGWYAKVGDDFRLVYDQDADIVDETDIDLTVSFILGFVDGHELNIYARFEKQYTATITSTTGGTLTVKLVVGGVPTTEVDADGRYFDENAILRVTFTPDNNYYDLESVDGLSTSEIIENDYVDITVDGARYLSFNFAPKLFDITSNNTKANGKIEIHAQQLSLNDRITITFNADSGYELSKWKLNGMTVDEINSQYQGANAVQKGNTFTFTVTTAWINDHGAKLDNSVKTKIDSTYLMVIIAASILIPLLLIGILLMLRANRKRKDAYAKAVKIRDERTKQLNISGLVSKLRSEENN